MSQASNYLENALMNSLFGKTSDLGALASAPTIYVALCTTAPTDTGIGTEAAYTSYARQATAPGDWNAAVGGVISNNSNIVFPQATGGSETLTHFALMDAVTGGDLLCYGTLTTAIPVVTGVTPRFDGGTPGNLTVTLD